METVKHIQFQVSERWVPNLEDKTTKKFFLHRERTVENNSFVTI